MSFVVMRLIREFEVVTPSGAKAPTTLPAPIVGVLLVYPTRESAAVDYPGAPVVELEET